MKYALSNYYYLFFIIVYMASIITLKVRPASILFIISLILIIELFLKKKSLLLKKNFAMIVFISYVVSSGIWFVFNELPFSVYVMAIIYNCINMFFFFFPNVYKNKVSKFYFWYIFAIIINSVFGIFCFFTKPEFYVTFWSKQKYSGYQEIFNIGNAGRLQTIFGSIETGMISIIGLAISFGILTESKGKKGKFALLICAFASILTQQRGPIFAGIFITIASIYLMCFKWKIIKLRYFVIVASLLAVNMFILNKYRPVTLKFISDRLTNPFNALAGRFENVLFIKDFDVFQYMVGNGIGSHSFLANSYKSSQIIYDGGYFNIIAELGLIGLSIFLYITLKAIIYSLKDIREKYIDLFIIIAVLFDCIGTTIFYYPQIMPVFWFAVGRAYMSHPNKQSFNL